MLLAEVRVHDYWWQQLKPLQCERFSFLPHMMTLQAFIKILFGPTNRFLSSFWAAKFGWIFLSNQLERSKPVVKIIKHSTIVIYDSRVILTANLTILQL